MDSATIVIKLGGHAMDDQELLGAFCEDIASLSQQNKKFVVVHGGGPQINSLLNRLRIESHFVDGLRVTDASALEAVEMALCASVNKSVTRKLLQAGARAAGISGEDGNLLAATIKKPALGKVGAVTKVNSELLHTLLAGDFTPVVAPLALDANYEPLNVNADTAAGAIAGALNADYFILISNVPGVLDKDKKLIPKLSASEIEALVHDGIISGGMIPKVECCRHSLSCGCKHALILDGTMAHGLTEFLERGRQNGTVIV